MLKSFIFDLDGTLVDSEEIHFQSYREVLKKYKIDLTIEKFVDRWLGKGRGMAGIFEDYNIQGSPKVARHEKTKVFKERIANLDELKTMPGVINFLKQCKSSNIPCLVASGSKREEIKEMLDLSGLSEYIDLYLGCDDVKKGRSKPKPDMFLLAAEKLGVDKSECLIFENAINGLIAAKSAGMTCYVIPSEITKKGNYSAADKILDSFNDLDLKSIIENN